MKYEYRNFYSQIGEALMTAVATRINALAEFEHRVIKINRRIGRIPKD